MPSEKQPGNSMSDTPSLRPGGASLRPGGGFSAFSSAKPASSTGSGPTSMRPAGTSTFSSAFPSAAPINSTSASTAVSLRPKSAFGGAGGGAGISLRPNFGAFGARPAEAASINSNEPLKKGSSKKRIFEKSQLLAYRSKCMEIPKDMPRIPEVFVEDLAALPAVGASEEDGVFVPPQRRSSYNPRPAQSFQRDHHDVGSSDRGVIGSGSRGGMGGGNRSGISGGSPYGTGGAASGPVGGGFGSHGSGAASTMQPPVVAPLQRSENAWTPQSQKFEFENPTSQTEKMLRKAQGMLNKLTMENFESLAPAFIEIVNHSPEGLKGVAERVHQVAIGESKFIGMYADLCRLISASAKQYVVEGKKVFFRSQLLNVCQKAFENRNETIDLSMYSEEDAVLFELKFRKRKLGNVEFIGELFKKGLLPESIVHGALKGLLANIQTPTELDVECVSQLLTVVGIAIDRPRAKAYVDAYFNRMTQIMQLPSLTYRHRFMLQDVIELRLNKWQPRRAEDGPKTIDEIHRDAFDREKREQKELLFGPAKTNERVKMDPIPRLQTEPDVSMKPPVRIIPRSQSVPVASESKKSPGKGKSAIQLIDSILEEYVVSQEIADAELSIKELNLNDARKTDVVSQAVSLGLEGKPAVRHNIQKLVTSLALHGLLSRASLVEGFRVLLSAIADIELDIPHAVEYIGEFIGNGVKAKYLTKDDVDRILVGIDSRRSQRIVTKVKDMI